MRLRKTMKRTAAAVLALSMAVSAAALPASAGFNIDMSKVDGDVEITQVDDNGSAKVTIKVGGVEKTNDFSDGKEGNDVTITGDNTKPTESQNAEEENTSEAEKSGENPSEVEKTGEDTAEAEKTGKTEEQAQEPGSLELLAPEDEEKAGENTAEAEKTGENSDEAEKPGENAGEAEKAGEPGSLELLAPEDEEKQAQEKETQEKPADSQEPEQTEKTEKTSDQVIEYGQYDAEAQQEAAKPAAKPAAEQETEEKKTAEEVSYEDTNAPASLTEKVQEAARNVVKIINNSTNLLTVIFSNLKVDAGDTGKDAVKIEGTGNVTLELEGKNELTGGNSGANGEKGISSSGKGKLTIQGKEGSSLSTTGGSGTKGGSIGIYANGKLDLVNATVTATGGFGGGTGIYANDDVNIKNSKLTAKGGGQQTPGDDASKGGGTGISVYKEGKLVVGEGSEVIAIGGDDKTVKRKAQGGIALRFWGTGVGCEVQKGGKLTAIGGNAESESGDATGGNALYVYKDSSGIVSSGETMLIGGNAKSGSGRATGGHASVSDGGNNQVTVKGGTTTALGGKAENNANTAVNGSSIKTIWKGKIGLSVETGGTFVTAMPGERDGKGNGITGDVEIKTDGGKIEEVENAKVVKKDDGTVNVVGNVVGVETGNLKYELTATVEPTCTTPGKRVYTCVTEGVHKGETYEEIISDALGHEFVNGVCTRCGAPESNGGSSAVTLTVTGAEAYETSIVDGRYIIAVPAETAVLSGCLGNLKELKAQGVNTLVFRTQLRETALNIDSMLSLGVDDTLFTLTHSGESAELTVGGFAHNELLH